MDARAANLILLIAQAGMTFVLCTIGLELDPLRAVALSVLALHPLLGVVSLLLAGHLIMQVQGASVDWMVIPALAAVGYVQYLRLTPIPEPSANAPIGSARPSTV